MLHSFQVSVPGSLNQVFMIDRKYTTRGGNDTQISSNKPPEVSVTVTTAAVPLAIAVALLPDARQMTEPVVFLHMTVLPAAVRADPAVTLTEATSAGV